MPEGVTYVQGSILDIEKLSTMPTNVDTCIHMAAQIPSRDKTEDQTEFSKVNEEGSEAVFKWCHTHGCKCLLAVSSAAVYASSTQAAEKLKEEMAETPGGLTAYAQAKWRMEESARRMFPTLGPDNNMQVNFIRLSNVYGPHQSPLNHPGFVIRAFRDAIDKGEITIIGDGEQTRDFIFVDDVCSALKGLVLACYNARMSELTDRPSRMIRPDEGLSTERRTPRHLEAFNCSVGEGHTIVEVAQKAIEVLKTFCPARTIRLNWIPASDSDAKECVCDNSKLESVIDWTPKTSLDKGLLQTANWFVEDYIKWRSPERQSAGIL